MVKVGILALQGSYLEHAEILRELGVETVYVKKQIDLNGIDALIIPGGEYTAMGNLLISRGLAESIVKLAEKMYQLWGLAQVHYYSRKR